MMQVKRLPVKTRVRCVYQDSPAVNLTGHKLHLFDINDAVFLRANAINNG